MKCLKSYDVSTKREITNQLLVSKFPPLRGSPERWREQRWGFPPSLIEPMKKTRYSHDLLAPKAAFSECHFGAAQKASV